MSTTPRRIGKYELQKPLGRGSAGEVWKGYDLQLRREVAIKLIHPDLQSDPNFMTRFVQEGEAVTALQHDNIVQIREVNVSRPADANATTAYLIMDYIEGQSLADYIGKTAHTSNFPAITDIAYLFSSLGSAVDYLHQNDIVPGNIKPGNILLDQRSTGHLPSGEPMLADFAMGKLLGTGAAPSPSSLYLSPEQAKGQPATPRSDIYSLGVILYELCTGVPPFRGESPVAVMMQHLNILPTPPALINPNVPAALSEVILRALAKDQETRYPTASLLAAAIADACSLENWRVGSFHRILAVEQARRTGEISRSDSSGPLPSTSILGVPVSAPSSASGPLSPINPSIFSPAAAMSSNTNPGHPTVSKPLVGDMPKRASMPVAAVRPMTAPAEPISPRTGPIPNVNSPTWVQRTSQQMPVVVTSLSAPVPVPAARPPATVSSYSAPIAVPVQRPASRVHRRNMRPFYLVSAAVVLILAALLGTVLFIHSGGPTTSSGTLVGHVFFQDDALGHDDTLRVELQGIPDAPQGQVYAAWLEMQNGQAFFLGKPTPSNGTITWTYTNSSHANLLATAQGFSITLENSGSAFHDPAGAILYKGSFEQASFAYVKNILYQLPGFPDKAGVLNGMFNTIKSINDKANSIDDTLQVQHMHDYGLVMRQATRILQLVDGAQYAHSSGDLPANAPALLSNPAGLISSPAQIGYLDALAAQVNKISQTTQDPAIRQHVRNVQSAITDLRSWVQNMRVHDVQLLKALGQQTSISVTPPSADLLNAALLVKKASDDSYTGRTIPPNESPLPILGSAGAYQAYTECQYMATLNIAKM